MELLCASQARRPAGARAERLAAFAEAGVQRAFVWPLADEVTQLEAFRERVVPLGRTAVSY